MGLRVLGLLLLAAGCGSAAATPLPDLVPVTGHVEMDGKPLAGVSVYFNPLQGTKGTGGYAVSDAEGNYKLLHRSQNEGCEEGEYAVTFTKITQPDGSPIPPNADRATTGMVEQMPAVYTTYDPSFIIERAKVAKPAATADFKLDSKRKMPPR